jgi:DNA-binding GntR family transcriptional regulator
MSSRVATFASLRPLKAAPLRTRAFEALRTAIFAGRFRPGDPLRELHLARDLNVSQATVRDALLQLEQCGLVVRTPNIGTEVTRLTTEDIRERLDLRALLEERAIVLAAPRMTADDFETLGTCVDSLGDAIARNDYFEEAQADLAFHRFIWAQSGNRTLSRTLDQLAVPLFAFISILRGRSQQTLSTVVQSHEGLVEALRRGDPLTAREALRQHFEQAYSLPGADLGADLPR